MRRTFFALLLAAEIAASPTGGGSIALAQTAFYSPVAINLSAYRPGALIRAEPMAGAPAAANAWRILYRSTGLHGEPIAVSGVVIVPRGVTPPGGRSIIAWAHPTTGIVAQCAPSLARVFFRSVQGLQEMTERGYAVAATDYPGLGTPEVHPYLVGDSEGKAVIDSVRAAHSVPGVGNNPSFAVWGHSQGGQAALFTGLLAANYAPELKLVGVAAAAPATDLRTLMLSDLDTSGGRNITAMTLWSWSRVYGASIADVVTPQAVPVIDRLANLCIERFFDALIRRGPTQALARSFLRVRDFADRQPWQTLLAQNTPAPLPARIPVFLAQGTADNLVSPSITLAYRDKLCRQGNAVALVMLPDTGHLFVARNAASAAIGWIADRFNGVSPPSNCGR
ncbi:MAG TPA: alpha/beta fold hydrolase [Rhizomicrobium sp.]|nr:alpha/beta fold hydrolase [Rhizomicrobium sp.]